MTALFLIAPLCLAVLMALVVIQAVHAEEIRRAREDAYWEGYRRGILFRPEEEPK